MLVGDSVTGAYCPMCRNNGSPAVQAMRDNRDCFCLMGHRLSHAQFWAMKPDMMKTEVRFAAGAGDVKAEVWVNQEVLMRAKEALGERFDQRQSGLAGEANSGLQREYVIFADFRCHGCRT